MYIVGDGTGATASATVAGGRVAALNLTNPGGGYTVPYVYVMNGVGSVAVGAATIDPAAGTVSTLQLIPGTSQVYTNYVKFGGSSLPIQPDLLSLYHLIVKTHNISLLNVVEEMVSMVVMFQKKY